MYRPCRRRPQAECKERLCLRPPQRLSAPRYTLYPAPAIRTTSPRPASATPQQPATSNQPPAAPSPSALALSSSPTFCAHASASSAPTSDGPTWTRAGTRAHSPATSDEHPLARPSRRAGKPARVLSKRQLPNPLGAIFLNEAGGQTHVEVGPAADRRATILDAKASPYVRARNRANRSRGTIASYHGLTRRAPSATPACFAQFWSAWECNAHLALHAHLSRATFSSQVPAPRAFTQTASCSLQLSSTPIFTATWQGSAACFDLFLFFSAVRTMLSRGPNCNPTS